MIRLEPGSLWRSAVAASLREASRGTLVPLTSESHVVEDGGIAFSVRLLTGHERKPSSGSQADPFLPYDPAHFVADISDSHVCLLNKFSLLDHHLLLVTRAFEPQESLLTAADFEALAACLAEFDALAFYNAGARAGASQRHKHLQLVPTPLGPGPGPTPMEDVVASAVHGRAPVPFANAVAKLDSGGAEALDAAYRDLRRALGLHEPAEPYNLLVTRTWMMLVPRARAECQGIPVNGLGFAGALVAKTPEQLAMLRERGPLAVLQAVAR